jgi:ParB/RepB/Spo0J family partition protein
MNAAHHMSHEDDKPSEPPDDQPTVIGRVTARARLVLAKRQSELTFRQFQEENGPQAELHTHHLYSETFPVPLAKIVEDPTFRNFRLRIDPVKLADLQTSIELEGLRVPVTVIQAAVPGYYHVRAGFRRTAAVRNLGWREIPAIVLPADMPRSEECWVNILENTNRDKLSHYELAHAARRMRDEFEVSGRDFAKKTGHSPDYVYKLLTCLDRLPPEVLQSWKNGDQVPFSIYYDLSCMSPIEAIKNLRLWMGQRRIERLSDANAARMAAESLQRLQVRRRNTAKLWTARGAERTQRLLMAVKVSGLEEKTKEICVKVIEYCLGSRQRIGGIVDDHRRVPVQDFSAPVDDDIEVEIETGFKPADDNEVEKLQDELEREHDKKNKT